MGKVFGDRWEIKADLGKGGQGETFLVVDKNANDGVHYALKRLINSKRLPRFKKEIETIRSFDHPHILRLVDADVDAPRPYLVSEYCERGSLDDNNKAIMQMGRDDRLELFQQVCGALATCHEAGVVHRDIKPSNVFLRSNGDAVLGDFGLAFIDTEERLTETLEAVGARYYMAPELAEGRVDSVTARSDIYSLGKLLYWLMTGRVFDREKHRSTQNRLHTDDISVEHIHNLLDQMIVEEPSKRLKDATEVIGKLPNMRRLLDGRYPPLNVLPQLCRYCGDGLYGKLGSDITELRNFGVNPTGDPRFHIFVCQNCGHVLMFRPDYTKRRHDWVGAMSPERR